MSIYLKSWPVSIARAESFAGFFFFFFLFRIKPFKATKRISKIINKDYIDFIDISFQKVQSKIFLSK